MSELHPYSDKVIVEQISEPEKSDGGIIRPDVEKKQYKTGKVIAIGQGFWTISGELIPVQTKVGDFVVYPKMQAVEYKHDDGKKYFIIRESELYLKLDNYEQK